MTIERTREILGDDVVYLTDEQIKEINIQSKFMCEALLTVILSQKQKPPLTKKDLDVKN